MLLIICAVFSVHCLTAFFLSYCLDTAELWKDDDEPSLQMPSIYDLPEDGGRNTMEKYIKEQIIPAHDYFCLVRSIKTMQDCEDQSLIMYFITNAVSTGIIGSTLYIMDVMPKFLCFALPFVVCVASSVFVHLIYKKSRFVICSNVRNKSSLKKEYDECRDRYKRVMEQQNREHSDFRFAGFEIDEKADFNNFVICEHYRYLEVIHNTVKRRYYVRKCISFVCVIIYAFFIMRVPD